MSALLASCWLAPWISHLRPSSRCECGTAGGACCMADELRPSQGCCGVLDEGPTCCSVPAVAGRCCTPERAPTKRRAGPTVCAQGCTCSGPQLPFGFDPTRWPTLRTAPLGPAALHDPGRDLDALAPVCALSGRTPEPETPPPRGIDLS